MKLMAIILTFTVFQAVGSVYSQNTTFNFHLKNVTVKSVLQEIENNSEFKFLYRTEFLDVNRKVNVSANNDRVETILENIFNSPDITYRIFEDNLIVITNNRMMQQQQRTISGKVTDASKGEPVPGVNVIVKGSTIGTITDLNGNFTIDVPSGQQTLVFSFIGMKTREVDIADKTIINVVMEEEAFGIEEVVAVGYGIQKKVNLTGSLATIDIKKLQNRPITDASQALRGLPGLYVNQPSGQPGKDEAIIRIRGIGTLNDNSPLVLYDGIEYSLKDITPSEIESITVLKDAASTAVYGSRAANGVILVTSKKGERNQDFRVEYNTYFGIEKPTYLPDIEWDPIKYMEYKNQALTNQGRAIEYPLESIEEYRQGMATDPYTYPATNWFDEIFRDGIRQEHNLTMSGGGQKHNLAMTLGYMNQDGILNTISGERYNISLNANIDINDFITIGGRLSGVYRKYNEPQYMQKGQQVGMDRFWDFAYRAIPIYPVKLADGSWGNSWLRTAGVNVFDNLVQSLELGHNDFYEQRSLSNIYANIKLPLNITYRINMAINKYDAKNERLHPYLELVNPKTGEIQVASTNTVGYRQYTDELNTTFFNTLEWTESISDIHNISILAGSSYESFSNSNFSSQKQGALDNTLTDLSVFVENPLVDGSSSKSALLSYFGRFNYNFNEKYLLEVNFRYDGSSRFAKGNRWGLFPSFSLGWRIDQEDFMNNISWIYTLKPRFSYGKIGNQQIALFSYANTVLLGYDYTFGTSVQQGAATISASDPDITWESTTIANLGLDAGFFDGRLNLTLDLYNKDTKDILRPINLPSQVGNYTGPMSNIGEVNNKGFEISALYRNVHGDFTYEFGGDFAYNKNKVVNLKGQQIISGKYVSLITTEGHPIDSYYLIEADGIFQSNDEVQNHAFQNAETKAGYLRYKDQNNDDVIDGDDRVIVHGVIPEITYAFNLGIGYKGFDVSAFFQGVGKIFTYALHNAGYPFYNGAGFTKEWETEAWTPDKPDSKLPILTTSTGRTGNFISSTFWLQNASYLRLKNLHLGYTFPDHIGERMFMQQLKVFINGQNLFTFTKMKDFDPEKDIKKEDFHQYPSIKTFTAGFNVTF